MLSSRRRKLQAHACCRSSKRLRLPGVPVYAYVVGVKQLLQAAPRRKACVLLASILGIRETSSFAKFYFIFFQEGVPYVHVCL